AARTRALDPAHIAAGLKDRFAVLASGPRTAPRRQASLEASFDWSYELLSDPERTLLRQLSVFAGGVDVEAALAVCPAATLQLLAALTDRSLSSPRTGAARLRLATGCWRWSASSPPSILMKRRKSSCCELAIVTTTWGWRKPQSRGR